MPASSSSAKKTAAIVGASTLGFSTTVLPVTMAAAVMPAMMAKGKFHGGMTAPHAERDVAQAVAFARQLDRRGCGVQLERLTRVELHEVDALAHVGVGLSPILADLVGEPCAELELALLDELRHAQQQADAAFDR